MDKVKQLINESINEELCIADEVVLTANEICAEISSWKVPKKGGDTVTRGFKTNGIQVSCTYLLFRTPKEYSDYLLAHGLSEFDSESSFRKGIAMLFVNVAVVSGHIRQESFQKSVMHEVEHLYQQDMRDKPFHEDDGNALYTATKDILVSCTDKETRKVAIAIYLSFDYEADAYLNELYSDMVGAEPDVFKMNEILQSSLVYKYLKNSQKLLDSLNSRTTDCSVAIDEYSKRNVHLTQNMIQNRVSRSVRRIYRKLGKVIVKAKKDTVEHAMGLGKRRLYDVI